MDAMLQKRPEESAGFYRKAREHRAFRAVLAFFSGVDAASGLLHGITPTRRSHPLIWNDEPRP